MFFSLKPIITKNIYIKQYIYLDNKHQDFGKIKLVKENELGGIIFNKLF